MRLLDLLRDGVAPVLFAPFAGSVLGVLVRRLPAGRPVGLARSACEACGRRLAWWEMVPLVGYAALGGRCRTCRAAIDPAHWWIELAAVAPAVLAVWAGVAAGRGAAEIWANCVLGWALLALGWIDWQHGRLPDALTLPLLLLGLGATWWLEPGALTDHAAGAAAGYVAFRLVAWGYGRGAGGREWGRGTRSCWRRRGPGWGGRGSTRWCCLGLRRRSGWRCGGAGGAASGGAFRGGFRCRSGLGWHRRRSSCVCSAEGREVLMDMRAVLGLAGLALLASGAARGEPSALCDRPEVLQEVARTVRQWNAYNTIDADTVREGPTERANAVVCHATMRSRGYRHYPDGWRPVSTEERRRFDVQVEGNRFLVQVPR